MLHWDDEPSCSWTKLDDGRILKKRSRVWFPLIRDASCRAHSPPRLCRMIKCFTSFGMDHDQCTHGSPMYACVHCDSYASLNVDMIPFDHMKQSLSTRIYQSRWLECAISFRRYHYWIVYLPVVSAWAIAIIVQILYGSPIIIGLMMSAYLYLMMVGAYVIRLLTEKALSDCTESSKIAEPNANVFTSANVPGDLSRLSQFAQRTCYRLLIISSLGWTPLMDWTAAFLILIPACLVLFIGRGRSIRTLRNDQPD